MQGKKRICLFDIDGTLTKPRNKIQTPMIDCLHALKDCCDIGLVGGSDEKKIREQIGNDPISNSTFFFSENGLIAYKGKDLIGKQSINEHLSEENLKKFINFCLRYIADIDIPIKRGTFIEYRTGMINVSPIGRNCSQKERDEFQLFDKEHQIRKKFINQLRKQFPELQMTYSIGGQISFDCMPKGWDKTFCLKFLSQYQEIYFFGDKTHQGGNDHQIYEHIKPTGRAYSVTQGPSQTIKIVQEIMQKIKSSQ